MTHLSVKPVISVVGIFQLLLVISIICSSSTVTVRLSPSVKLSAFLPPVKNPVVRQQKLAKQGHHVLIVLDEGANKTAIRENFQKFQQIFSINMGKNTTVHFENGKDLKTLVKYLENPKYTTVLYVSDGYGSGGRRVSSFVEDLRRKQAEEEKTENKAAAEGEAKDDEEIDKGGNKMPSTISNAGFCDTISTQYTELYNKSVLFWPCPKMKKTQKYLPSFETVSYAVKSVSQQFGWKEAVLFAAEPNWGLPLAIAANLHVPYRIKLGVDNLDAIHVKDHNKKVIIVCSPLNSVTTSRILRRYKDLQHANILLIDIIGSVFNTENEIYTYNKHHNIFVLTILSEKFKNLLNTTFTSDFSHYYRLDQELDTLLDNETTVGNDEGGSDGVRGLWFNETQLFSINANLCNLSSFLANETLSDLYKNQSLCETKLKRFCRLPLIDISPIALKMKIKQLCHIISNTSETVTNTNNTTKSFTSFSNNNDINPSTNHIIFSEYFNLFNYVVYMVTDKNSSSTSSSGVDEKSIQFDFVILDFKRVDNGSTIIWRPFLILQQNQMAQDQFTMHTIISNYFDQIITSPGGLVTCGIWCWIVIAIVFVLLIFIIFISILIGIAVRNYLLKKRLSKGPNKIVLSTSDFVFPVDARRVDEGIEAMLCCWLQQLQEFGGPEVDKPDLLKGSIGSLKNLGLPTAKNSSNPSLTRHNTLADVRARYNGDIVQLKEINGASNTVELKTKAMDHLLVAHALRHENINPLIGWISDPQRTAMVFEYCSRGSLQDVLIMDEIKLDWSFRLSLLTDLVRGMRYLHSSPIRVHGALSSRNCVVDARWVLKITDYGVPAFYEAQGLPMPTKTAKELLWTAPEALRGTKNYPKCGTQPGDVYSFGIIMQEVVVRGEPYCMLSLSPDEIIAKIKKPPPLIRPSVSKGAAPPEAINIMRQCWAENPEMRPDFVTVCERFKQLNQGRKVNFVDTMFQMLEKYSNNLEELIRERTEQLEIERKKTEQLLNRMLPNSVAEKLKMGLAVDPEEFSNVTIYFSDIVGFTTIAAHCTAVQVVDLLNDLYTCFDATINAYNVYKVETIGDAYMVVSGLPLPIPDHSEQIATMALDLLHQSGNFKVRHLPGVPLQLRIGLHTGPCCAGVVGLTMPRYCLFGDTVNTASRMESTGSSWRIHMSQEVCDLLEEAGGYIIEPRGPIEIKGKGTMNTYWLLGKEGFNKTLPTPPPIGESHGLDESLIRNSMLMKSSESNNRLSVNTSSSNPSSSHSPSVTGESIDVKVEITPPPPVVTSEASVDVPTSHIPKSFSNESTSTLSVTVSEYKNNTPSPQQRKYSEIGEYSGLLSAVGNLNRLNPSPTGSTASTRFFKRIEEMIDLSSPYNHYKCLSPSETNLSQFIDARTSAFTHHRSDSIKPGSGRLLRRQFSLDKDDAAALQQSHRARQEANKAAANAARMHKQHSISTAQDLEKIEENPISPQNCSHSNGNDLKMADAKSMSLSANDSVPDKNDLNLNVERLICR
ncbi:uncharacterized protein LOC134837507 [Culicoides brevitarsis]|uniref:uncharacterized protein LOC134837507 n=1 Tax=Culicoides brevitarsis TaxID=469753 RepID=UPI00307B22F9